MTHVHVVQRRPLKSLSQVVLTALAGAKFTQNTISGLKWIAQRTSAATTSLRLAFSLLEPCTEANPLVAAFSGNDQLSNLKCLTCLIPSLPHEARRSGHTNATPVGFLDWLLEQATRVEALNIHIKASYLPASHITFQHVRHLMMSSHCEGCLRAPSSFLVAQQLPALETLLIEGTCWTVLEVLDMSGCIWLRRLALSDNVAANPIWDVTSSGPCPLALELLQHFGELADERSNAFYIQAAPAQQLVIREPAIDSVTDNALGLFSFFSSMKALTLEWPNDASYDPDWRDNWRGEELDDYLASYMPRDGQPLLNLESIFHHSLQHGRLPSRTKSAAKPQGACHQSIRRFGSRSVRSCRHHFRASQPVWIGTAIFSPGEDTVQRMAASSALERRGLVLSAAAAAQQPVDKAARSCIYLRPVGACELSIEELSAKVEQLVKCR